MATVDLTRIGSNIAALNALNSLKTVNNDLALHQQRLSTGKQINSAGDNPADLTLSTELNVQDKSLQQANSNISDAQNLLSTAEGGLDSINSILSDMRVKAQQAASDTLDTTQRQAIDGQLQQYSAEIDNITQQTAWNGQTLLSGAPTFNFQSGANESSSNVTSWTLGQGFAASTTGNAGLALATVSTVATAAFTANVGMTLTGATAATTTIATGGVELGTGSYTVELNIGSAGATNATADSTISLLDSNGHAVTLYQGTGSTTATTALSFAYQQGGTLVTLGNGLVLTLGTINASTQTSGTASFAQAGTYTTGLAGTNGSYNNANATAFMTTIDTAIATVSAALANIGAMEDRLTYGSNDLTATDTNVQSSYNQIMNADMASEQVAVTKDTILQSTATSMLASANSAPQAILKLFQ